MAKLRAYVGKRIGDGSRIVVHSDVKPTEETHGDRFSIVEGPFKTVRGARFYAQAWNERRPITQDQAEAAAAIDKHIEYAMAYGWEPRAERLS